MQFIVTVRDKRNSWRAAVSAGKCDDSVKK
uniref:Uncharacterized protein n=1 Tax=Anguilla anguilla TaxID=7936 RepID=A0A0E9XS79_ANGAN